MKRTIWDLIKLSLQKSRHEKNSAWSHMSSFAAFCASHKVSRLKMCALFPSSESFLFLYVLPLWEVYACRRQTGIDSLFLWQISLSINTLLHTPSFSLIFRWLSSISPGAAASLRQQQHKLIELWNMSSDSRDGHSTSSKLSDVSLKFAHVSCLIVLGTSTCRIVRFSQKDVEESGGKIQFNFFFMLSHTRYAAASILCREKHFFVITYCTTRECWAAEPFLRAAYTYTYSFSSSGEAQREKSESENWKQFMCDSRDFITREGEKIASEKVS